MSVTVRELAAEAAEAAAGLRVLLDEIEAGNLSCSAAFRHRAEGAVIALDSVSGAMPNVLDALREGTGEQS